MMTVEHLKEKFIEKYGGDEISGYFSPGRVNLIGEHTDYNGGYVFPCAISFGNYCLIRKTERKTIRLASLNSDFETEVAIADLNRPIGNEWVNYPIGVFAQFLKRGIVFTEGADLLFYGNVPSGAGLSSSAALEMVTAIALNDIWQFNLDRLTLIKMSQKAEHEFAGVMCGIMDQFASGMGKANHAIFLDCDTLDYTLVPVELGDAKVVISNTNSPHKLDSGKYNQRVAECQEAVKEISKLLKPIKKLVECSMNEFNQIEDKFTDETARRRARHVISEIARTEEAVRQLKHGNIERFGELMNASHDSLKNDYDVTGEELDTMVEEARKIEGVIGSRMTGGGFGGCTVSVVKDESIETFIKNVGENYRKKTGLKADIYVAEISDGSKKLF
jgi:galactokinase